MNERGFSLVETLIATAVIAVMAALTFQLVAANAQSSRAMAERRLAALVARSALDLVSAAPDAAPRQGRMAGLVWSASIEPWSKRRIEDGPALRLVTVTAARPGAAAPLVRLRTLRVVS